MGFWSMHLPPLWLFNWFYNLKKTNSWVIIRRIEIATFIYFLLDWDSDFYLLPAVVLKNSWIKGNRHSSKNLCILSSLFKPSYAIQLLISYTYQIIIEFLRNFFSQYFLVWSFWWCFHQQYHDPHKADVLKLDKYNL